LYKYSRIVRKNGKYEIIALTLAKGGDGGGKDRPLDI